MTAQMPDFFEYEGHEYCLVGWTGGKLTTAEDLGMRFGLGGSTATVRGYGITYGIESDRLVVKCIEVLGEEITPIKHQYQRVRDKYMRILYDNLNHIVPLTGYVLFGYHENALWYLYPTSSYIGELFEVAVESGLVKSVHEIGVEIRQKLQGRNQDELIIPWRGTTDADQLVWVKASWDVYTSVLPRRYDAVHNGIFYFNFREVIEELEQKLSGSG
jgi:hypothetical protein